MRKFNFKAGAIVVAAMAMLIATQARAAVDFTLSKADVPLTGPFGTVSVDLVNSTTATITLQALGTYSFGDGSTLGLNLNGLFSGTGKNAVQQFDLSSSVTLTGRASGGTPSVKGVNIDPSQTVDGWGSFNYTIDLNGGFGNSATKLVLTLTRATGTWGSVNDILSLNSNGYDIEGHVMNFDGSITGFAVVPEPTTIIAGALLLLPFGAGTMRVLRKNRAT